MRLPESLLEPFLTRVATSAPEEVRRLVGGFFREWARALKPDRLAAIEEVDRLVTLVETDPSGYLPILRAVVEQANHESLDRIAGDWAEDSWGPRRKLVWLAERLAMFPEFFDDAESILLRFALAESEPGIGNNATAIWCQLFRILGSGTAVTFQSRLHRLEERIRSTDQGVCQLAFQALAGSDPTHQRDVGPS